MHVKRDKRDTQRSGRRLLGFEVEPEARLEATARIEEDRHAGERGHSVLEYFKPFAKKLGGGNVGEPGDVPPEAARGWR